MSSTTSGGVGFGGLLTIVFITLKLTGTIAWSWWWVLSPLWIPTAIALGIFGMFGIIGLFALATAFISFLIVEGFEKKGE